MKIFFDVDGVLIDGWHADSARRRPWDATIGTDLGVDREAFQRLFFSADGRADSPMLKCVTGRCDLNDALAEVLPQVGYSGSVANFMRYWFEQDSNVNFEVVTLVQQIRERSDAEMFVATGQEHHRARYLWDELGFAKHFDGLFYSAKIGFFKRDRRFFDAINRALGIGPEEQPLFFDDQPEIIEVAKLSGWNSTIFTSPDDIKKHPRLHHLWT